MQIFNTTQPFQQTLDFITKQDDILEILAIARPDLAKIDSAAALSPLRDVTALTDSLMWYEFLEQLRPHLCKGHKLTPRAPTKWVTEENVTETLSLLGRKYSVPPPHGGGNATRETIFLRDLNNLFYCAWESLMLEITSIE